MLIRICVGLMVFTSSVKAQELWSPKMLSKVQLDLHNRVAIVPLRLPFKQWQIDFERTEKTFSGYALLGKLVDQPLSTVVVVVNGDLVEGFVNTPMGSWRIRNDEVIKVDGEFKCEVKLSKVDTHASKLSVSLIREAVSQIDLLVIVARRALQKMGTLARLRTNVDLAVALANEAYRVGGVNQLVRLVGVVPIDYYEARIHGEADIWNMDEDYKRLRDKTDGYMDQAYTLRELYAADLVHLIGDFDEAGGRAGILNPSALDQEENAFGISNQLYLIEEPAIFAHELGHNMGLLHDRYVDDSNFPTPWAHGYVNQAAFKSGARAEQRWRTIMAYSNQCQDAGLFCSRVLRFSNPKQLYKGDPLGIPGDQPTTAVDGPADAVRALNENRGLVANLRDETQRCVYNLSTIEHYVAAEGGTFSVQVSSPTGCDWNSTVLTEFVTIETGTGTSRDIVNYTITPNNGAARIGYFTIAGETVTIRQSGAVEFVNVCERTSAIRDSITQSTRRTNCRAVTEIDLLEITKLDVNFNWVEVTELRVDDFAGLTNLTELRLRGSQLETLPAGIFRDLVNLTTLSLRWNSELSYLPTDTFVNQHELKHLDLSGNNLKSIPRDLFSNLTKVKRLNLSANKLHTLPEGVFRNMGRLRYLHLNQNYFTELRKEMLDGITRLSMFQMERSAVPVTIREDLFANIDEVYTLRLQYLDLREFPIRLLEGVEISNIHLSHNQLTTIPAQSIPGGNIRRLILNDNQLSTLSDNLFVGFTSHFCQTKYMTLDLTENPGAPFALEVGLRRADNAPGAPGPAEIYAFVPSGAPLPLELKLQTKGGILSQSEIVIPNGVVSSDTVQVESEAPTTVTLVSVPKLPSTYKGLEVTLGKPLHLFLSADFNADDQVGFADFVLFSQHFGVREGQERYQPRFDLDRDGMVGFSDFLLFVQLFDS